MQCKWGETHQNSWRGSWKWLLITMRLRRRTIQGIYIINGSSLTWNVWIDGLPGKKKFKKCLGKHNGLGAIVQHFLRTRLRNCWRNSRNFSEKVQRSSIGGSRKELVRSIQKVTQMCISNFHLDNTSTLKNVQASLALLHAAFSAKNGDANSPVHVNSQCIVV